MTQITQMSPATNLDDVYKTLSTRPLLQEEEFHAFYRGEINEARGEDQVAYIEIELKQYYNGAFCKTFLTGHSGVGKSTEMTRLSRDVADKFRVIRFSAQTDLDAAGFKPFDALFVMMIKLAEEMKNLGWKPSKEVIEAINRWFAVEKQTITKDTAASVDASAGIKPSPLTSFTRLLGFFAELKGEIKYTQDRKQEVTLYRLNAIATLIDLLNRLFDDCNRQLKDHAKREWLFIGENFDKPGIPPELTESLFIGYANIFSELRTHLIFSIPITLAYSDRAAQLPLPYSCIPDTPVFDPNHRPHEAGRAAVRAILEARIAPELFEDGQMMRLIVASGGNLRNLFEMVTRAANSAAIRAGGAGKINPQDAESAIAKKRNDYLMRLGVSPYDPPSMTYEAKADLLLKIYHQKPECNVPNPVLHSLLRARAVQEFNGTRWFGVHPLVVDILKRHGKLKATKGKPVLGGTD